ncbi:MAG: ABC transporter permease subunit [Actinobacteria bacterium]|uniref:Unannotated protein n=1 Tax=freshwater metagenome TaxID=449393 RepID=A0A6J6G3F7_9ZZZZ|nr:ABC transporter permease subunit [Actinomycetota bacterium]MTA24066.1 ABC transporter permease subunit [Actinomycetota bacterium]
MASNRKNAKFDIFTKIALIFVIAIIILLVLLPLANIFKFAMDPGGRVVFTDLPKSLVDQEIVKNTLKLGLTVGTLGTLLGFFLAYTQTRIEFKGKRILHVINLIPIISPPFALATAVIVLFGRSGLITRDLLGLRPTLYGYPGLVIVLTLSFFPVAYMNILGMMKSLDPALDEAGSILGANRWKIFKSITVPLLIPGIAGSFLLLFIESIADLANPLIIGGGYTVLASRAYISINGDYNIPGAAGYSLLLLIPALLVFLIQRFWSQRNSVISVTGKPTGRINPIKSGPIKYLLLTVTWFVSILIAVVYLTVIMGSFASIIGVNNALTLEHFRYVLSGFGGDSVKTTVILALIATPIAGMVGMLIAWLVIRRVKRGSQILDFLGMLGIAVPGTVIGIGYAITYNDAVRIGGHTIIPQLSGGGAILGGAIVIVMVYVIRSSPAGQRSGIASLQQIDPSIDEASSSLGASGFRTFRLVTLPLIRGAFLTGLMYAFAHSMTTLSPIIFLVTADTPIMTQKILAEADQGRYGNSFAFCVVLIVIVLTVMGLINLAVRGRKTTSYKPLAMVK